METSVRNLVSELNIQKLIKYFNDLNIRQYVIDEIHKRALNNDFIWYHISVQPNLSEEFIREFQDKVCWDSISEKLDLSEDFIIEFQDKVYWGYISFFQKLSEDFIRKFQDKVFWNCISCNQILSEDFIREFQDKVCWDCISECQKLSKNFIMEFKNKLYFKHLILNKEISKDILIDIFKVYELIDDKFDDECPICINKYENPVKISSCNHIFCKTCINKWLEINRNCPYCRNSII